MVGAASLASPVASAVRVPGTAVGGFLVRCRLLLLLGRRSNLDQRRAQDALMESVAPLEDLQDGMGALALLVHYRFVVTRIERLVLGINGPDAVPLQRLHHQLRDLLDTLDPGELDQLARQRGKGSLEVVYGEEQVGQERYRSVLGRLLLLELLAPPVVAEIRRRPLPAVTHFIHLGTRGGELFL